MAYTDTCSEDEILSTEIFSRVYDKLISDGKDEDFAYSEAYAASMQYLDNLPTMYYPQVDGVTPTVIQGGNKVDIDVIQDRKQFYVQEGKNELRNAMDFLHLHYDNWNPDCEQTFRELVNHASEFLAKAYAMDDLLATR